MGYHDIRISPLNGELWVFTSKSELSIVNLIKEDEKWIREWLEEWHPYKFDDGITERYTRVSIYGIPLVLWNENFIQWTLAEDDIVIEADSNTRNKSRLDITRVRIQTIKFSLIQRNLSCSYNQYRFSVFIVEETYARNDSSIQIYRRLPSESAFRVRPESKEDGSVEGESYVPDSVEDDSPSKKLGNSSSSNSGRSLETKLGSPKDNSASGRGDIHGGSNGKDFTLNRGKINHRLF